ncbi:MAG: hypothetical protein CMP20_12410 [Rickettsiales bacterium]|nr:hypothetical protein [Rickettsiales bacterium]
MRFVFLLCLLLPWVASAESLTETFCEKSKANAAEILPQLPIHKDAATIWLGYSAVMLDGTCHVRHEYLVRSEKVVDMTVKNSEGVTHEMVEGYLQSDEAREKVKAKMQEKLRQDLADMLVIPNVVYIARVQTSGPLQPFNVEIRTGTAM